MEVDEATLAHFGKMGMKWGVRVGRKSGPNSASAKNAAAYQKKKEEAGAEPVQVKLVPGKGAKASGGRNIKPTEEAVTTAVTRQKIKKSGIDSVSNKEMQDLITRMNLEQQYAKLSVKPRNRSLAAQFTQEVLVGVAKDTLRSGLKDVAQSQFKGILLDTGAIRRTPEEAAKSAAKIAESRLKETTADAARNAAAKAKRKQQVKAAKSVATKLTGRKKPQQGTLF